MSPQLEVGSHAEPTEQTVFEQCEKDPGVRHEIGHTKRFLERWTADPGFKRQVADDPYEAVKQHGIDVDPEVIRPLFDRDFAIKQLNEVPADEIPLPVRRYRGFIAEKFEWRSHIRSESAPRNEAFRAWRERQLARANIELSRFYNDQIVHVPVTFELSVGCSVGCWFCGVGARKLADHFTYDRENSRLWRDVLPVIREICGPGARYGFCYWATDPMDNPDYEKFCSDFTDVMGLFPQTTTAIAMRDPERTRRLLVESAGRGCRINRFSVLTLKIFNQIHETFTADELAFVELVTQNKEADSIKAQSGHYLESAAKNPVVRVIDQRKLREGLKLAGMDDAVPAGEDVLQPGTTACVSGFLINMVERTVKLISPCYASERWPLGYMVFDQGRFDDAAGFRRLLETMVAENMPSAPPASRTVRFAPGLTFEELPDGFQLSSRAERLQFQNSELGQYLKEIGRAVKTGTSTTTGLALRGAYEFGVPEARTHATLKQFLGLGVLDEVYAKDASPADAS